MPESVSHRLLVSHAPSAKGPAMVLVCLLFVVFSAVSLASAQQVDVSLNLEYNNVANPQSGGTWTLVAKTDAGPGIASLSANITGITTSLAAGPTGLVNGNEAAGFNFFSANPQTQSIQAFQIGFGTTEQSYFYGIGSVANGAPDFADAPMGATLVGPELTTLTDYSYTDPWGATGSDFLGDPIWDIAVPLAQGQFAAGLTPDFVGIDPITQATVFGTIPPNSTTPLQNSDFVTADTTTFVVRSDLIPGPLNPGDYNLDGVVNAADYGVWLNTLGEVVPDLFDGADGDGSGTVDLGDYNVWKMNFGNLNPGVGSSNAIPEPASAVLLLVGLGVFGRRFCRM